MIYCRLFDSEDTFLKIFGLFAASGSLTILSNNDPFLPLFLLILITLNQYYANAFIVRMMHLAPFFNFTKPMLYFFLLTPAYDLLSPEPRDLYYADDGGL